MTTQRNAGLIPVKVTYRTKSGKLVTGTRMINPHKDDPAQYQPKRESREGKKLKQNQDPEVAALKEATRQQEAIARREKREHEGKGEFEADGPRATPWYENAGVVRSDTDDSTTYSQAGLAIHVVEAGGSWRIYRNGKFVGTVNRERDAANYAETEFNKLKKSVDGEEVYVSLGTQG